MNKFYTTIVLATVLLALIVNNSTNADDVRIVVADFHSSGGNRWSVNVTLKHGDTGWDHYVNNWRLVDDKGNILGNRVLYHPHVEEQPFTRSLNGVTVPAGISTVYIEAHDKIHGWTQKRLKVDLTKANSGRLRVEAE